MSNNPTHKDRMIEITGYCWKCGRQCKDLFCSKKHQEQYERQEVAKIRKGKRAGYGLAGSTH